MVDVANVESTVKADVAKAVSSFEFVKANWVKVSIAIIASAAVGFLVRSLI